MALTVKIPATARYAAPVNSNGYIMGSDEFEQAGTKNVSLAIIKPDADVTTSAFYDKLDSVGQFLDDSIIVVLFNIG